MKDTIRKLIYILPKGDPFKLFILFVLMMLAAGLEVAGIGMIPVFVSIVADPERVLEYEPIQFVLTFLNIEGAEDLLIWGSIVLVLVFLVKSVYNIAFNYFEARFIFSRRYQISHRMMSSYMQAPYTFHLQRNTSELLRNITSEVNLLINGVMVVLLTMTKEMLMALGILTFLLVVEPLITLLVILLSGAGAGSFILLTRRKLIEYGLTEQGHREEMIRAVNQGLGGLKEARVLNREGELIEKFRSAAYRSSKLLTFMRFIKQIPKPVVETTAVVGMLLISAILVWEGRSMSAIIPILTLFAMAIVRLMPAVQSIASQYSGLQYNMVSVDPVYEDLVELNKHRKEFAQDRKMKVDLKIKNRIIAENVVYSYPDSAEQALKGVSFSIKKGSAVAFIGESGAGKTTIVDLLLCLLKPESGQVLVDGKNIHKHPSSWQKQVGYIPQSIYLADDTIRANIAFGLPEKEIDDDKVMKAVELAQLGTMVKKLPNGLNTLIGEHGTRISGGQRQRVGIARALYHNPQVLVMDEATSALDNITEKHITEAIEALRGDRTIIMIAHRLTTVKNCDMLYFMKDGKIEQMGSYDELVKTNSHFREMALEV